MGQQQIDQAMQFGREAHAGGIKSAPALDSRVTNMLAGRSVGETPVGEAPTVTILSAWSRGWHEANTANRLTGVSHV